MKKFYVNQSLSVPPVSQKPATSDTITCRWGSCNASFSGDAKKSFLWAHVDLVHFSTCQWGTCNESFLSEIEFRSHVKLHSVPFCIYCGDQLDNHYTFKAHARFGHGRKHIDDMYEPLKLKHCDIELRNDGLECYRPCLWRGCPVTGLVVEDWAQHLENDHINSVTRCQWGSCRALYDEKIALKSHVYTTHLFSKGVQSCFICSRSQKNFYKLRDHLMKKHKYIFDVEPESDLNLFYRTPKKKKNRRSASSRGLANSLPPFSVLSPIKESLDRSDL